MDAQTLEETRALRRFTIGPVEVTVHKNPERDRHDDHDCLITITVKDDDGLPDKMLTQPTRRRVSKRAQRFEALGADLAAPTSEVR